MSKLFVLVLFALLIPASQAYAYEPGSVSAADLGSMRVTAILEAVNEHGTDILIGASSDDIASYLPGGHGELNVLVFAVQTEAGAVLIDTGFGRNIEAGLSKIGLSPSDISTVLITHAHGDHIGGLTKDGAPAYPNAKVYITKRDFNWSEKARDAIAPYGANAETFEPGAKDAAEELIPGIRAVSAYGHTPGHTVYVLESAGERMMIAADLVHVESIQMPRPNVSMRFDSDPVQAAQTRADLLSYAAESGMKIAGMHLSFPSFGTIKAADGAFVYQKEGPSAK